MKTLGNINLTLQELKDYQKNYFDYGSECIIVRGHEENKIFKLLTTDPESEESSKLEVFENKYQKILRLFQKQIKFLTLPTNTLSYNNYFIGYEMDYSLDDMNLIYAPLEDARKISILKDIRDILLYFNDQGIIYGDIKNDNILINAKNSALKFCDSDNIMYQGLPMDVVTDVVQRFQNEYGKLDEKLHSYMHNLLTLEEIDAGICDYPYILEKIKSGGYNDIVTPRGKIILKEMTHVTSNYSGSYLIDTLKW